MQKEDKNQMDVSLIIYSVADVPAAKRFFRELIGADPYVESAPYTGFKNGAIEIGLVPSRGNGGASALPYWTVDDIAASVSALEAAGGTIAQKITDVANGLLVASVKDPNGATIGLRQMPKG
jgi:predicted enzyme related to lactoylglutathione lyase